MNESFNLLQQLNKKQCLNLISLSMISNLIFDETSIVLYFVILHIYQLGAQFSREQKEKMCLMSIILRRFDAERANFELKWGGDKLQC